MSNALRSWDYAQPQVSSASVKIAGEVQARNLAGVAHWSLPTAVEYFEFAFSEVMDPMTLTGTTVTLKNSAGATVPATVTVQSGDRAVRLFPATALNGEERYTFQVSGYATDHAPYSNPLCTADYCGGHLYTVETPDATPPTVTLVDASTGAAITDGRMFLSGQQLALKVTVADRFPKVCSQRLTAGGTSVTGTGPACDHFTFAAPTVDLGSQVLSIVIQGSDEAGNVVSRTIPTVVQAQGAPRILSFATVGGASTFTEALDIALQADVSDDLGVTSVTAYLERGGTVLMTAAASLPTPTTDASQSPPQEVYSNVSLSLKLWDVAGDVSDEVRVWIKVVDSSGTSIDDSLSPLVLTIVKHATPPAVTLVLPRTGDKFVSGTDLVLYAVAHDPHDVAGVYFFENVAGGELKFDPYLWRLRPG